MHHLLTFLLLLPVIGTAALLAMRNRSRVPPVAIRFTALGVVALTFLLSLILTGLYRWDRDLQTGDEVVVVSSHQRGVIRSIDPGARQVTVELGHSAEPQKLGMGDVKLISDYAYGDGGGIADGRGRFGVVQFVEHAPWIPPIHAEYRIGIDGLSLPLVVLTTVIFCVACAAAWKVEGPVEVYFALLLLLESALLGLFLSLDLFLFLVFFELSLVPAYFLMTIGSERKNEYAAVRFFLVALLGSVILLIAVIGAEQNALSLDIVQLPSRLTALFAAGSAHTCLGATLFALFMLAFLMRMGAPPLHAGATAAVVESPAPLAMILATLFPASGGYAILRIAYPFFAHAAARCWLAVALLGVLAIVYGALCALSEQNLRKWVSYSSISQMGYATLGAAMMTTVSTSGALFMIVAHGIVIAMLVLLASLIDQRAARRRMGSFGVIAGGMPRLRAFTFIAFFAVMGLPGLCGFIGQFMVLAGSFQAAQAGSILVAGNFASGAAICVLCAIAGLGSVLAAASVLVALRQLAFGPVEPASEAAADLDEREIGILAPLAALAVFLGVVPHLGFFAMSQKTIEAIGSVERGADFPDAVE